METSELKERIQEYMSMGKLKPYDVPSYYSEFHNVMEYLARFAAIKDVFVNMAFPNLSVTGADTEDEALSSIALEGHELAIGMVDADIDSLKLDIERLSSDIRENGDGSSSREYLCIVHLLDDYTVLRRAYEDLEEDKGRLRIQMQLSALDRMNKREIQKELLNGGAEAMKDIKVSELKFNKERVRREADIRDY